jgi:hypothetical protein
VHTEELCDLCSLLSIMDNIKLDLRKIGWGGVDWIGLAQSSCEFGDEPSGSIKCWEIF